MQAGASEDIQTQVQRWLSEYSGAGIAVAELLCDRHARMPERIALFYEDASGQEARITFAELRERSARFAGALQRLGVAKGDRVATLLPKSPELLIATLGLWRLGAVHVPLFTAFGPQAIAYRVVNSGTRVIITDTANRPKLTGADLSQASVSHVITIEGPDGEAGQPGDVPFWTTLRTSDPVEAPAVVTGDDLLILLYTSGTTGHPKGVEVPVRALASFAAYMHFGLDLREEDMFWNIADPGWAYGLYYGLVGPLLLGKATLFFNAPFNTEATCRILAKYQVTNFAAAPTVYRALRAAGVPAEVREQLRLRVASSAGEPLNPDVIAWAVEHLGVPIYDQYGQTELGMVVNNHHLPALERPLRPGSMGQPMPGFRMVIVDEAGNELGPRQEGQVAVDVPHSPLYWFRGYYQAPEWTAQRFSGGGRYYLTGDAASYDADGYFYFSSRADDVITSAGYRIGPFEVESALMQHQAVAEAAAVGKPDALRGEVVKAYVVLKPGYTPSAELADELSQFVKANLAAHAYPREIAFIDQLPKTPSGKVQRFLLRERERAVSS
jgi:acetyl-CoA synthetase